MQRTTITVLGHTVECNTGNIIPDESLLDDIHDMIYEEISAGETSGEGPILCEVGESPLSAEVEIDVIWKIVNPEAEKWRSVADKLYSSWVNLTDDTLKEAIQEYKQLIEYEKGK